MWDINWPMMNVMIGGDSAIDLKDIGDLRDAEDAGEFLKGYGFDLGAKADAKAVHALFVEALNFIATELMPKEWHKGLRPPKDILCLSDLRELILLATASRKAFKNRSKSSDAQAWACAILRVMHTIAHIDQVDRFRLLEEARAQIFSRFQKLCHRKAQNGLLLFGRGAQSIPIEKIEWKNAKTRNSIILKLLHKPANVSENVYDLIGVRLVTASVGDSLLLVNLLREEYAVTFGNTNPTRARNTLLDLDGARAQVEELNKKLHAHEVSAEAFLEGIRSIRSDSDEDKIRQNPHSSLDYRAIQMTCRQRIRYSPPVAGWYEEMGAALEEGGRFSGNVEHILKTLLAWMNIRKFDAESLERAEYFPFEVQIMDRDMASEIDQGGHSSHARYKKSQIRTARRRILSSVLEQK